MKIHSECRIDFSDVRFPGKRFTALVEEYLDEEATGEERISISCCCDGIGYKHMTLYADESSIAEALKEVKATALSLYLLKGKPRQPR